MSRTQALSDALRRMVQAVNRLGERDGRLTYFEHDVTKNGEAQKRWKELSDAVRQASSALAN
jgi:hypothetical protein